MGEKPRYNLWDVSQYEIYWMRSQYEIYIWDEKPICNLLGEKPRYNLWDVSQYEIFEMRSQYEICGMRSQYEIYEMRLILFKNFRREAIVKSLR